MCVKMATSPPPLLDLHLPYFPAPAPSIHMTSFHSFISLLSLSSRQTFSDSLSRELGSLSSLISKQVSPYLPIASPRLPIQPTLGSSRACSLRVENKSSGAHFRVQCDYSAAAFMPLFSSSCFSRCGTRIPVVFRGIKVLGGGNQRSEKDSKRRKWGPGGAVEIFHGK